MTTSTPAVIANLVTSVVASSRSRAPLISSATPVTASPSRTDATSNSTPGRRPTYRPLRCPIAFTADRNATCLGGYTTLDLVTSPIASTGACTCGCQISAGDPPSCAKGSFVSLVGSTTCNGTGQTYTVNGTGCTALVGAGGVSAFKGDWSWAALVFVASRRRRAESVNILTSRWA